MCQPLKQCQRAATVAWCASEAAPTLMALGSSANSAAGAITGGPTAVASLDLMSFDLARAGTDMDQIASVPIDGGRRFSSIAWGLGPKDKQDMYPYGIIAGGLQDGTVCLWNPYAIAQSRGADTGLLHSRPVHKGAVNCIEFHPHPDKHHVLVTCGSDGEVKIIDISNPTQPAAPLEPSATNKHAGSEVLWCAWNPKVPHILCSCSNTGTTIVWDLKQKKEVISFQDPANRLRCSGVAWHPEVATQLIVTYDDDRQPSMQMWDLRNCTYPFKETAGHSKGILGIAWNAMDPNLLLSCSKDSRLICWSNSTGTLETFCEIPSQQGNFEVKWAPHRPSLVAAASSTGTVSIHSVQMQQTTGAKYCPKWYTKPCGASFGFGGKMLSFGAKTIAAAVNSESAKATTSFCHSLVIPNEPEIVSTADDFERWIAERRLQEYCHDKTQRNGSSANEHERLMWDVMGSQFEESGRARMPALLGFDKDQIIQEAESFLGRRAGSQLMGPPPDAGPAHESAPRASPQPPDLDPLQAEDFFTKLTATTELKRQEELERETQQKLQEGSMGSSSPGHGGPAKVTDWSAGPEKHIKHALLIGNITAAVECCFKSGRMAEGLLLASGGGTDLWTRARDEYLRLQGDTFLTTVGNIMTNDFEQLVGSSNLANWKETLAIIATYAGEQYRVLCERLAERLEKEKFDIRSAVICYICSGNFPKTVSIWANTHLSSPASQKLALQDLVEKMAVLQEATKFNQADTLFNAKLTQYAEILANSGRLTAAMRYLCLLRDDASSAILRERIYNSAPMQMSQMFGRPPTFPFDTTDVRITYQAPAQPKAAYGATPVAGPGPSPQGGPRAPGVPQPGSGMPPAPAPGPGGPGAMPPRPGYNVPGMPPAPAPGPPGASGMPPRPGYPGPGMGHTPAPGGPGGYGMSPSGGYGGPGHAGAGPGPAPGPQAPPPAPPGPAMGPAPKIHTPAVPSMPGASMGPPVTAMGGGGMGPGGMGPGSMGPGGHMGAGMGMPAPAPSPYAAPGVLPPGQSAMGASHGMGAAARPEAQRASTAPTAAAMPVSDGMPVSWPLPTAQQQRGCTNQSVAGANRAIQENSLGGGATVGEPMASHELTHVKNVLNMLLDTSAQDGNAKKRDDIAKRLDELYTKLQAGHIKTAASQKVLQMVKAVEAQDFAAANKMQMELCSSDWDQNRNWLMGVKRLIPAR